nr:aminodeoxychorismate/anthranilate synthase component II [Saprospiraceae bacterium]
MKITLIDNYDSFTHLLWRLAMQAWNTDVKVIKNDCIQWEDLDRSDLILLSPGPGLPAQAGDLMEVIERYHNQKSFLGICLGHQALAEFFGAELLNLPQVSHGKRSTLNILERKGLFKDIKTPLHTGRYHSWVVNPNSMPEELCVSCEDEEGEIMGIRHRSLPIEGLQFHPESYMTTSGIEMLKGFYPPFR